MLSIPFIYHAKESLKGQSKQNQINILFNCMILVLYATYLSYSRATWVGLTASLGLMFSITSIIDYQFNRRSLFIILGGSLLFTLLTYLFLIFNIASISTNFEVISFLLVFVSLIIMHIPIKSPSPSIIMSTMVVLSQYMISSYWSTFVLFVLSFLSILYKRKQHNLIIFKAVTMMMVFINIQFIGNSLIEFTATILLIVNLFIIEPTSSKKNITSTNTIFKWKMIVIGVIGLVIISPNLFLNIQSNANPLIKEASTKINSYKNVAIEGTARTSMWKSSFPWIKDHQSLAVD